MTEVAAASPPPGRAWLVAHWVAGDETVPVQYNPGEFTLEKRVQFAEIAIPGLTAPLQQFVRGLAELLTVELFFDTSDGGMGAVAKAVTELTDKVYSMARIEPAGHAPPTVTFHWGEGFPGRHLSERVGGQGRDSFTGVITSIRQSFTLFSRSGLPLRARLNLSIAEVQTLDEQLRRLNRSSPDRTHGHVLRQEDQLWSVAQRHYARPAEWRRIAEANGIEDARRLVPGTPLAVPSIESGGRRR